MPYLQTSVKDCRFESVDCVKASCMLKKEGEGEFFEGSPAEQSTHSHSPSSTHFAHQYYAIHCIYTCSTCHCCCCFRSEDGEVCSDITLDSSASLEVTVNMTSCLPNTTMYVSSFRVCMGIILYCFASWRFTILMKL